MAESYPAPADPVLKPKENKPGETYWSRGQDEPNTAFHTLRNEIQADIDAGNYTPYFDPDQRYYAGQVGEV
ncbi:MAG: hypothetical protein GWN18_18145, partial [Thermoplasmata archaeon]|nr:hypothetical protein [Thermoplasmata archaeon]NIS21877.1 hypothetical protein [Thermoplasmata archaeon]NIT79481.1 hypothetical protein [Thermoplasmata archaeon]NIV80628.1 hypothetical protein [Thermoplasmata archaeon]NIW84437.1 hypothetical protein [Thermoplasmata archaeon]